MVLRAAKIASAASLEAVRRSMSRIRATMGATPINPEMAAR